MGQEVAVATKGARIVSIDLKNLNFGVAQSGADKFIASVGGSGGSAHRFPGRQISFKSGLWQLGFGDKAKQLKSGTRMVINVPNMMAGWVKWEENGDKKRPVYTDMRFPFAGDDPITRDSLGDHDKDEWDTDNKTGQPIDPWRPVLVFPSRDEDGEVLDHVFLNSKSACMVGFNMYRDVLEDMKLRPGQLPIVELAADKAKREREIEVEKRGKMTKQKDVQIWDVPTLKVVGWTEAQDFDNPGLNGVEMPAAGVEAELGNVTASSRVEKKEPAAEKAKPAAEKKSRRTVVADDEDESL